MATICASTNNSPNFLTVSLYSIPTKSVTQNLQLPSSSHKISQGLVSDDTQITAAKAVPLAHTVQPNGSVLFREESEFQCGDDGMLESRGMRRRRRRRKRRKEKLALNNNSFNSNDPASEEAEWILYIQEGARLEAARRRACEMRESDFTISEWAETVGMTRGSLERILLKAREARGRIVLSYRRLVAHVANNYQGRGLPVEDLIQEGSFGLLRGVEKFNLNEGCKLSTYVYWWIRWAIVVAIQKNSRLIKLPGHIWSWMPKVVKARKLLCKTLRRQPTTDEIADMTGVPASSVWLIRYRTFPPISLDRCMTDSGNLKLQDIIPGPEELNPDMMVIKQAMKEEIHRLVMKLSEREAFVLRQYYGLDGVNRQSCQQIATRLNISRERARQIHHIALNKLRNMNNTDSILGAYMIY